MPATMLHSAILEQASPIDALMDEEIAICDAVRMEVLVGGRDEAHLQMLRRLLALRRTCQRLWRTMTTRPHSIGAAGGREDRSQADRLSDRLYRHSHRSACTAVSLFWLATRSCTSMKLNLSEPWPRTPSHEVNGAIVYRMDPHTVGIYQQVGTSESQRKRRLIKWSPQY